MAEAIESSIAAAYKRSMKSGEIIKAKFNTKTGDLKFWQVKTVVDETTVDLTKYEEAEPADAKAMAGEGKSAVNAGRPRRRHQKFRKKKIAALQL